MGLKSSLLLLIQVILASCQQEPFISFITKEQYTDIGGKVEIHCTVQFALDYPVLWMRLPDLAISSGETKIVPDERFSVSRDGDTFILTISDLQETDSKTYQCQVLKSAGDKITADVFIGIRRPPVIKDDSSRDMNIVEGNNVTLFCDATGFPEPIISWRKIGHESSIAGGSTIFEGKQLSIPRVTKDDHGTYVCVAENGMSKGDRRNIKLQVEYRPQVTVPLASIGQMFQYPVEFECNVEAFPPPSIVWQFQGVTLNDNMHYSISNFLKEETINTKLKINAIEQRQFGSYVCKATNRLGIAYGEVKLLETYVPNERFVNNYDPSNGDNFHQE